MDRGPRRRLRRLALLGVMLHAAVLTAAPFEHHDLICHLKTPQHCTSCTSSPVGSSTSAQPPSAAARLAEAGAATTSHAAAASTLLSPRRAGRSPPAHAQPS